MTLWDCMTQSRPHWLMLMTSMNGLRKSQMGTSQSFCPACLSAPLWCSSMLCTSKVRTNTCYQQVFHNFLFYISDSHRRFCITQICCIILSLLFHKCKSIKDHRSLIVQVKYTSLIFSLTGEWLARFDPHFTSTELFYIDEKQIVNVDMMLGPKYPLSVLTLHELDAQVPAFKMLLYK